MSKKPTYPLEQLVRIKNRRLEAAEKVLKQKKEALDKEKERLKKVEVSRDETINHRQDKIDQLRETLDAGTTSDKVEMMKVYIKEVDGELKKKIKKVEEQQKVIEDAKEKVEEARKDLYKKQQDVEKLNMHRKEWDKEMKALEEYHDAIETDELGSAMFNIKKFKKE